MRWGIIGAMASEVEQLQQALSGRETRQVGGFSMDTGTIAGQEVAVVQCGIGKVAAALCAQTLLLDFQPDYIVNTGVAGSLDPKLDICDVVLSRYVRYHDATQEIFEKYHYPAPQGFVGDEGLRLLALKAADALGDITCRVGDVATGDIFVADQAVKDRILQDFPCQCVEMEGAAIAHAATLAGKPFLVIRSISDKADHSAEMDFGAFEAVAANNSARLVLEMLRRAANR